MATTILDYFHDFKIAVEKEAPGATVEVTISNMPLWSIGQFHEAGKEEVRARLPAMVIIQKMISIIIICAVHLLRILIWNRFFLIPKK